MSLTCTVNFCYYHRQIYANPNFNRGAAQIILNQVTSNNISSLNGYTEIFGQKADYIFANPNGISCNNCGFINTSRLDRKSTRLNSSHVRTSRMPSSA